MKENKIVYIASPFAGDIEANMEFAKDACRYAISQGAAPIAVHLLYPQILNDSIPEERETGIQMGLRVLKACDELWVCGEHISHGMQKEIETANSFGIPIKSIPSKLICCQSQELSSMQMGMSQ